MLQVQTVLRMDPLQRYTRTLESRVHQVISTVAHNVESTAKQLAPVDTGALRNSIHVVWEHEHTALVAVGVDYAVYVELGTSRTSAQPFLLPAAEQQRSPFVRGLGQVLREVP